MRLNKKKFELEKKRSFVFLKRKEFNFRPKGEIRERYVDFGTVR